jgi:hypothetical protein
LQSNSPTAEQGIFKRVAGKFSGRTGKNSLRGNRTSNVRFREDCVAKLFLGVGTKFSSAADALVGKSCGGSHDQSDFQRAAFVSSLRGIGLPNIGFDRCAAKFYRQFIFEFCNTITSTADIG